MPDFSLEIELRSQGSLIIAGIDEAGRGPLAGPVYAAAVVLPEGFECPGLDDSKKLSAAKREEIYEFLISHVSIDYAVASADLEEILAFNILGATHLAMRRAVCGLKSAPCHCLIDGLPVREFPYPQKAVVKGDGLSLSIAAASVLAKVSRDRWMREVDREFPQYGFIRHQGYGTREHLEALRTHGPCRHHRRSFQPVAQLAFSFDES